MVNLIQQKQQHQDRDQGQESPEKKGSQVPDVRTQGFYISYAAAGIVLPLMVVLVSLALTDHSSIGRLEDKLEFLNAKVVDSTVVARLVDHDQNLVERIKVVDDRLKSLETFAGSSTQDRAALHYEMSSLRDYLKYLGKVPPDVPHAGDQGQHP